MQLEFDLYLSFRMFSSLPGFCHQAVLFVQQSIALLAVGVSLECKVNEVLTAVKAQQVLLVSKSPKVIAVKAQKP